MDISVKKGPTGFPAGPILGELQQAGIPASIEKGKITITKDAVVVKEGQRIAPNVASCLARLGIEPMEIGLDVLCAYEDGTVFLPETLAVDETIVLADIQKAYQQAVNLSVNVAYPTKQTVPLLIAKAAREATALAVEATIFEPEVMDTILSRAHSQMMALALQLNEDALDDDLKEQVSSKASTQAPAPAAVEEEKEAEEEEPEEEVSEEDAAAGLGALFG
jgi:large subunit ribosomal protein L10